MLHEMTEMRSVGGFLHWLVGQMRPDLAPGTSLYMSRQLTVNSLVNLNKLLREAKQSDEWSLTFHKVSLDVPRSWSTATALGRTHMR